MFYASQDSKDSEPVSFTIRVRGLSKSTAQTAAQGMSSAAQAAGAGINKGFRQGVHVTRVWAAPRLESVADYTTATAAPKVSSALRTTAQQVRPVDVTQKKSRSMLTWSLLAAAVVATAGAVAALIRYKQSTTVIVVEEEEFSDGGAAGGKEGTTPGGAASAESSADAGVNGRVSTSG